MSCIAPFLQLLVLGVLIHILHICWCAEQGGNYIHLRMPQTLSPSDQLIIRTGYDRGTIGTPSVPIILPPEEATKAHKMLDLYDAGTAPQEGTNDAKFIIRMMRKFYESKRELFLEYSKANEERQKLLKPYIADSSQARLQFMAFFCLFRRRIQWNVTESAEKPLELASRKTQADLYAFCPDSCANREGPGMDNAERTRLTRFTKPCSYPDKANPFDSKVCEAPKSSVTYIHRQSFQCACHDGSVWNDQLKTCVHPLLLDKAQKECSSVGTQYIGGVGIDDDTGGAEVLRSLHQTYRCVCKPNYYGTLCDKVKDPCTMSIGDAPPGNIACQVTEGNKCAPYLNESTYNCTCGSKYRRVENLNESLSRVLLDNCMEQINPCVTKRCVHGICVLSDEGIAKEKATKQDHQKLSWYTRRPKIVARCLCNAGWTGEQCALPVALNSWTPWSPWSGCEPNCQSSITEMPPYAAEESVLHGHGTPRWGVRERTRYRECVGEVSDCYRDVLERTAEAEIKLDGGKACRQYQRRECRTRPCDRHLYLVMGKRAVRRSGIMKQVREALVQAQTVHLWTAMAFAFAFAMLAFIAAFATKMHSEKVAQMHARRGNLSTVGTG